MPKWFSELQFGDRVHKKAIKLSLLDIPFGYITDNKPAQTCFAKLPLNKKKAFHWKGFFSSMQNKERRKSCSVNIKVDHLQTDWTITSQQQWESGCCAITFQTFWRRHDAPSHYKRLFHYYGFTVRQSLGVCLYWMGESNEPHINFPQPISHKNVFSRI